ncbi:MAG: cyclic nucleotide-binding domain-containing protein [Rhizomicrobium sp.]
MLQIKATSSSSGKSAATAAVASDRPSGCTEGCTFFQSGACKTTELRGPRTKFARRQPVYSEGDAATHCYRVVEGAVRLSRILSDGHRQILDILMPGDSFGLEVADYFTATAEAVGEVVLLRCPRACIERRSETDHRRDLLVMLSRSLTAAQDHVAMLGHQGAKERVAAFLIKLAHAQNCGANQPLDLPIGRQDIADYLGLTIETTCRTMTDLKISQIISIPNRSQVVIRNFSRLEAVAEGDA